MLVQLEEKYPEDVRVVYRHFPLISIHDKAALSAQAAEAAGRQGKFWEMHDLLFTKQAEWVGMPVPDFTEWLVEQAGELELDQDQFRSDMLSDELAALAQQTWDDGIAMDLQGTPTLVLNGQEYRGPSDLNSLSSIVELFRLEDRQFTTCPPMTIDPAKRYIATVKTEKGDFKVELLPQVAPMAVNSFVFLAENNWFDGVTFHRVLPGFVAQAGDPTGTGLGGPGYAFDNEISPDLVFDRAGLLAMANAGPGSNGSQFYVTLGPAEHLNGGYTIFGEVIEGMPVVESLTPRDPQRSAGLPPGDKILDVTIEVRD